VRPTKSTRAIPPYPRSGEYFVMNSILWASMSIWGPVQIFVLEKEQFELVGLMIDVGNQTSRKYVNLIEDTTDITPKRNHIALTDDTEKQVRTIDKTVKLLAVGKATPSSALKDQQSISVAFR
jgi:hypothetical protein